MLARAMRMPLLAPLLALALYTSVAPAAARVVDFLVAGATKGRDVSTAVRCTCRKLIPRGICTHPGAWPT